MTSTSPRIGKFKASDVFCRFFQEVNCVAFHPDGKSVDTTLRAVTSHHSVNNPYTGGKRANQLLRMDGTSNHSASCSIKGSDTGWTLGYMLTLTNLIPAEAPDTPPLPHAGYVSIVTVIALVLFVLFIFSLRRLWPRCSKQLPSLKDTFLKYF